VAKQSKETGYSTVECSCANWDPNLKKDDVNLQKIKRKVRNE